MEELFDKIINRSLKKKATDIHFVLKEKLVIRMRILGDLVYYDMMNKEEGQKLMNFMKYQAKINTNYRFATTNRAVCCDSKSKRILFRSLLFTIS